MQWLQLTDANTGEAIWVNFEQVLWFARHDTYTTLRTTLLRESGYPLGIDVKEEPDKIFSELRALARR
jgi:hypothetical protein